LVLMPSQSEWEEAYERLEQGESYGSVSDWLGVSKSGLYERHERYLRGKVEKQKAELQEVVDRLEEAEEKLLNIEDKYREKKEKQEEKLEEALEGKREELSEVEDRIAELREELKDRGITIEDALDRLQKLDRLEDEVEELGQRKKVSGEDLQEEKAPEEKLGELG